MNQRSVRYAVSLALAFATALPIASKAAEPCLAAASGDYGIPPRILDAMRMASAADRPTKAEIAAREFGPMGLGEPAIHIAAKAIGVPVERAKMEACANYRAAAWLLDDARRRVGGDIWAGLRMYMVGQSKSARATSVADEYVATIKQLAGEK